MCQVDFNDVASACGGSNTGGNKVLYVSNDADILDVPAPDVGTSKISADLVMVAGKVFRKFTFTKQSCQHTEADNEGRNKNSAIVCRIDKDDAAKRHQFEIMYGGEYTCILIDGNDLPKIAQSCTFKSNFDSGTNETDVNGYEVRFEYTGKAAKVYTGAIPTS
ncbi:MAG: hypothetical protein AAFR59_04385 [Bacteroidota bacterium]